MAKHKFEIGNPGGPGRPKKEREVRFMEITLSAVTFEDWQKIVEKAVIQAKRGDNAARKWLGDYLVGVPVQRIAPTDPSGENPYMALGTDELIELARKIADARNPAEK
jgi:hypothetical protein